MITIQINSGEVTAALTRLQRSSSDLTDAMDKIGEHIASFVDLNFRDATDPEGVAWEALKPETVAQRRNGGNKPLNDTGRLKSSITYNSSSNSVVIGTNVLDDNGQSYAATHQFGDSARHIPARPFLANEDGTIPQDWESDIVDIIHEHLSSI